MPIPALNEHGWLSAGIHDGTLDEIRARFGSFRATDRRPQLFAKLAAFVAEAVSSQVVREILVDGSFVTATASPNDVDLFIIVAAQHDLLSDLSPTAYNVLSKRRVQRRLGFDMLVAREGSEESRNWIKFFQKVRLEPNACKGIVKLLL